MDTLVIKHGNLYIDGHFTRADMRIAGGNIVSLSDCEESGGTVLDAEGKYVVPGFVDLHAHFREPGFSYKETIRTGSMAAAAGGYTTVCTMPNLDPVPDTPAH